MRLLDTGYTVIHYREIRVSNIVEIAHIEYVERLNTHVALPTWKRQDMALLIAINCNTWSWRCDGSYKLRKILTNRSNVEKL